MQKYVQRRNDLMINGFKAAGITEIVEKAKEVFHIVGKLFIVYQTVRYIKNLFYLG